MKKISINRTKTKEINEYQLSLIIHLFLLLALSIVVSFKSLPKIKTKIVPVSLIAKTNTPQTGSVVKNNKIQGSKKSEGNTNKAIKKQNVTSKKSIKTQSNSKPTPKTTTKPTTKPVTKKATVSVSKPNTKSKTSNTKTTTQPNKVTLPVVAVKPAQTNLPSIINKPTKNNLPTKPTHNSPLFEEVNDLSKDLSQNNPILNSDSSSNNSAENSILMPESMLDDSMVFTSPTDIPSSTGETNGNKGNGLFEVDSIETFGGNSEYFIPPSIISKVQPEYPDWARKQGVHGNAIYRVLIQPSGTVGDVVTVSSTIDPKLAINCAQALRRWVFTPVLNNGVPQETWVKISVHYELN